MLKKPVKRVVLPKQEMKNIIIAWDCDGVILDNNGKTNPDAPVRDHVIELIKSFSQHFHNVYQICWSGNGKEYAEGIVERNGLQDLFAGVHSKLDYDPAKYGVIDIAFDDWHDFAGGHKNLILKL